MDDTVNSKHSWFTSHENMRLPDGCSLENEISTSDEKQQIASFPLPTSFIQWTESFDHLLEDLDGVSLFRLFLEQNDVAKSLEFLFACRGLKLSVPASDKHTIYKAVKAIYRKYLRGDSAVPIESRTKRSISEKLCHKSGMDHHILDPALEQVENQLRSRWYPMFIQSNLFYQYMESHSSISQSAFSPLLHSASENVSAAMSSLLSGECPLPSTVPLTKQNLAMSSPYRSNLTQRLAVTPGWKSPEESRIPTNSVSSQRRMIRSTSLHQRSSHTQHHQASYLPVSTQDSEMHSVSSDAQTDETQSHTGSSLVDSMRMLRSPGAPHRSTAAAGAVGRFKPDSLFPLSSDDHPTQQAAVPRNSARTGVGGNVLHVPQLYNTGKERCLAEVDPAGFAKILCEKLQNLLLKDDNRVPLNDNNNATSLFHQAWAGRLLAAARKDCADDQQAQTILEEHCSRVWHTPPHKEILSEENATSFSLAMAASGELYQHHHHNHLTTEHKHIHHHHYHPTSGSSNILGASDASSNIDSGVSLIYDTSSSAGPSNATCGLGHSQTHYHPSAAVMPPPPPRHNARTPHSQQQTSIPGKRIISAPNKGTSDHSNTTATAGKPYPAEEKVLAWMMGSKQLPIPNSTSISSNSSSFFTPSNAPPSTLGMQAPHMQPSLGFNGLWQQHYVYSTQQQSEAHAFTATSTTTTAAVCDAPSHLGYFSTNESLVAPTAQNNFPTMEKCLSPVMSCRISKSHTFPSGVIDQTSSPLHMNSQTRIQNCLPMEDTLTKTCPSRPGDQQQQQHHHQQTNSMNYFHDPGMVCYQQTPTTNTNKTDGLVIGYYLCGDPVPYRSQWHEAQITLSQFKQLVAKRGNFRYFFKTASNEFDTGVVHEEIVCDQAILPLWEGKVVAKIERID